MKKTDRSTRLIVLSAPSGAGKTTLCHKLLKEFPNIQLSISATTRPKRPKETDGVHYHFLNKEQFVKTRDRGGFIEWAQVHDNLYGTLKVQVDSALSQGKNLLFDIDVQGAKSLLKTYGDRSLLIFIHPPSMEELKSRLINRKGDKASAIETRLQNAYNEVEWSRIFHYQITNDNLDQAYQKLKEIVETECP